MWEDTDRWSFPLIFVFTFPLTRFQTKFKVNFKQISRKSPKENANGCLKSK